MCHPHQENQQRLPGRSGWVLKDWWYFLGRNEVGFRQGSFQADGFLSGKKSWGLHCCQKGKAMLSLTVADM